MCAASGPPSASSTPPVGAKVRPAWLPQFAGVAQASVALTVSGGDDGAFLVHRRQFFSVVADSAVLIPATQAAGAHAATVRIGPLPYSLNNFHIRSLSDPTCAVLALRFLRRETTADAMLRAQVGRANCDVRVQLSERERARGEWTAVRVLAVTDDSVLVATDGGSRLASLRLPLAGLSVDPASVAAENSMLVSLRTTMPDSEQEFELSFASRGITWDASYSAVLSDDGTSIELDGHYIIRNHCGKSFEQAQVMLCSHSAVRGAAGDAAADAGVGAVRKVKGSRSAEKDGGHHRDAKYRGTRYVLGVPVDLPDNAEVQVLFSTTLLVSVQNTYRPIASESQPFEEINLNKNYLPPYTTTCEWALQFKNPADVPSPQALPSGRLTVVYRQSNTGLGIQMFSSFTMPHTKPGDLVTINMGPSQRIRGDRKRLDIRMDRKQHTLTETFAIQLRRRRGSEIVQAEVTVEEQMLRWREWRITSAVVDGVRVTHSRISPTRCTFPVNLDSMVATLAYTVQYFGWHFPHEVEEQRAASSQTVSMPPPPPPMPPPPPTILLGDSMVLIHPTLSQQDITPSSTPPRSLSPATGSESMSGRARSSSIDMPRKHRSSLDTASSSSAASGRSGEAPRAAEAPPAMTSPTMTPTHTRVGSVPPMIVDEKKKKQRPSSSSTTAPLALSAQAASATTTTTTTSAPAPTAHSASSSSSTSQQQQQQTASTLMPPPPPYVPIKPSKKHHDKSLKRILGFS